MGELRLRHVRWKFIPKWQVVFQPRFPTQTPSIPTQLCSVPKLILFKFDSESHYIYLLICLLFASTMQQNSTHMQACTCTHIHVKLNDKLDLPLCYFILTLAFIHVYSNNHLVYIFWTHKSDIFLNKGVSFFFLTCECIYLKRQQQARIFETEVVPENLGQINSCCKLSI